MLAALNGFGGRWTDETPNPGDAAFGVEVAAWRQLRGVSEVQAVLYRTLADVANPSAETQWLLSATLGNAPGRKRKSSVPSAEVEKWLAFVARELLGLQLSSEDSLGLE